MWRNGNWRLSEFKQSTVTSLFAYRSSWAGALHRLSKLIPKGAVGAVFSRGSNSLFAFISTVLLARVLGTDGYGAFAFAFVVTGAGSTISALGLDQLAARELAILYEARQWENFVRFVHWGQRRIWCASMILVGAAILLLSAIEIDAVMWRTTVISLMFVPAYATVRFLRGQLQALDRTALGIFFELPFLNIGLLIMSTLLAMSQSLRRPEYAALGFGATLVAAVVAATWFRNKELGDIPRQCGGIGEEAWNKATYAFAILGVLTYLSANAEVVLVGMLLKPQDVGLYSVANRIGLLAQMFLLPIQMVAAPRIAHAWSRGEAKEVQRITAEAVRGALILSLPAIVVMLLIPRAPLSIFGAEFARADDALRIIALAQLSLVMIGPGQILLPMINAERLAVRCMLAAFVVQVIATASLAPPFGIVGAAIGRLTGSVVLASSLVLAIWKHSGVVTVPIARGKPHRSLPSEKESHRVQ